MITDTFSVTGEIVANYGSNKDAVLSWHDENVGIVAISNVIVGTGSAGSGAHVIASATVNSLRNYKNSIGSDIFFTHVQRFMKYSVCTARNMLGIPDVEMCAINTWAIVDKQRGVHICLQSSGIVAIQYADGAQRFTRVLWDNGIPFLPLYNGADQRRLSNFIDEHGGKGMPGVTLEHYTVDAKGSVILRKTERCTVMDGIDGIMLSFSQKEMDDITSITLLTDGIGQIADAQKGYTPIPWVNVVRFLTTCGDYLRCDFLSSRWREFISTFDAAPQENISGAAIKIAGD